MCLMLWLITDSVLWKHRWVTVSSRVRKYLLRELAIDHNFNGQVEKGEVDGFITLQRSWSRRHTWHGMKNGKAWGTYLGNLQVTCYYSKRTVGREEQDGRRMPKWEEARSQGVWVLFLLVTGCPWRVFEQRQVTARVSSEENTLTATWKMDWMEEAGSQTRDGCSTQSDWCWDVF